MGALFAELKRRHMYRVAAAYAVVAWILLQLVNNLTPALNLPSWMATAVVVLLALGFPIALLFCWIQHMPADDGAAQQVKTNRVDWVLAGGLAAVIAIFLYQQLAPGSSSRTAQTQQASSASAVPADGISIAVLPFANLSGDASQEFFSDGVTEEITAQLAKVPSLRTVGRSSAFQFKGQNRDLRAIGQSLGAAYLIDGSVRKAGDQVRITAQLVQAENGVSVWTDSYDRELKNIFATQSDIARAIAGALRVPLGLRGGEAAQSNGSIDPKDYEQYLRARALYRSRGGGVQPLTDAATLLEQIVARNPSFAVAWGQLALVYVGTPAYHPIWATGSIEEIRSVNDSFRAKAEAAGRRALELDENLPDGHLALGRAVEVRGKPLQAEEFYAKALALDPNNPEALQRYSLLLTEVGKLKDAMAFRQRLQALEPLVPIYIAQTAQVAWLNGDSDGAIAMLKTLPPDFVVGAQLLAEIYAAAGRYNEAADIIMQVPSAMFIAGTREQAARLLRAAPAAASAQAPFLDLLAFAFLHAGAPVRSLEYHERNLEGGTLAPAFLAHVLWHPSYSAVRKTDRFKALVRKTGLIDYWRAKGWPESCKPVGADDFVCT